ncbi:hypothetical protein F750_6434 [Streptomyces sp. PAMC 26508]|nr:hypothetical protein F750_6434 [Streptomyces sp. PAMC 26508]
MTDIVPDGRTAHKARRPSRPPGKLAPDDLPGLALVDTSLVGQHLDERQPTLRLIAGLRRRRCGAVSHRRCRAPRR